MVDAPPRGHPELRAALAAVTVRGGARSAQVLDGRTGTVVAAAGVEGVRDAAVMVALAGSAGHAAAADGGLTDLVVTTGRGVHLLYPVEPAAAVVHVRFDPGRGDLAAARAAVARPEFRAVVLAAVHRPVPPAAVAPSSPPRPMRVPAQRRGSAAVPPGRPADAPNPAKGTRTEAAAGPTARAASTGALAVLALEAAIPGPVVPGPVVPGPVVPGPVVPGAVVPGAVSTVPPDSATPAYPMPVVRPLPRRGRARSGPRLAGVAPEPDWAQDVRTMHRVLTGLRRLG